MLLTTPMEVYRRQYIRGARRLAPNANTPRTVNVIRAAAAQYRTALWDFYAAAGGEGANAVWHGKNLIQRDRVHFTQAGYEVQADMLYAALMDAYMQYSDTRQGLAGDAAPQGLAESIPARSGGPAAIPGPAPLITQQPLNDHGPDFH